MAKNLDEIKGLIPLKKKKKTGVYDGVINDVRTRLGIPLSAKVLMEMATDAYIKKNTKPNGDYDLNGIVGNFGERVKAKQKERENLKLVKRLSKLKEKQIVLEVLLKK